MNDHYQGVVFLISDLCFTNYGNKLIKLPFAEWSLCYTFRNEEISKEMPNFLKIEKDEQ